MTLDPLLRPFGQRYPALARQLPFTPIADLPTPLEPTRALGARLGITELLVKRDDRCGPLYGGNKVRKLEYLLGDALGSGCDAVLTYGAAGSNHALATSIYARALGLKCYAVLVEQAKTPWVAMTLRYHAHLGTELIAARTFAETLAAAERLRATHPGGPERVYKIPFGGSSWLGTTGFVAAACELAEQFRDLGGPPPDSVYVPYGTAGTAMGLALGFRATGLPTRVVSVRVVPQNLGSTKRLVALFDETNRELHARDATLPLFEEPLANVDFREEFLGAGYADATPGAREAISLAAELEEMHLETTYSGKAMACLIADARAGRLRDSRTVFWNTYNSRPYPELPAVGPGDLPAEFQRYF